MIRIKLVRKKVHLEVSKSQGLSARKNCRKMFHAGSVSKEEQQEDAVSKEELQKDILALQKLGLIEHELANKLQKRRFLLAQYPTMNLKTWIVVKRYAFKIKVSLYCCSCC